MGAREAVSIDSALICAMPWFLVGTLFMLHLSSFGGSILPQAVRAGRVQIQKHPCKGGEVEPGSPALTLSYVPSCSSGSPLFPDCLFSKLNYANTSQPSFHGNHISRIPRPVLWQKRPTQVTTTQTRTNGREASLCPRPSVSVSTEPSS